jgi:dihydrofolate reductase
MEKNIMRKLKLEVQLSIDGFVADPKGKTDWMIWDWKPEWHWDEELRRYHIDLQRTSDTILLGRKMAVTGFFEHWEQVAANQDDPQYAFAKPITEMKKYVFTKTLKKPKWKNTELVKSDFVEEIKKLKKQSGKDIIVYGGASFVASLIKAELIDEYHLLINPTILGKGKAIFKTVDEKESLVLVGARAFNCGVVNLQYHKK